MYVRLAIRSAARRAPAARTGERCAAYSRLRDCAGYLHRKLRAGDDAWLVRVVGQDADPGFLARLTVAVPGAEQRVPIDAVAEVARGRATPRNLASADGRPAILLSSYNFV